MKNILVGIDFEEDNDLLIKKAIEFSKYEDAKILLLHASSPNPDFVGLEAGPQFVREVRAEELKQEHIQLQKLVKSLEEKGAKADALLIRGATIKVILDESKKLNVDLIIVGHHKHNFIYNMFFGHQDFDIIRSVDIPVLVVPLNT